MSFLPTSPLRLDLLGSSPCCFTTIADLNYRDRDYSTVPDGAYFILVNTARLDIPADFAVPDMIKSRARDWKAAWFIAQTRVFSSQALFKVYPYLTSILLFSAGVVCIPPTDFYSEPHWSMGENFIRLLGTLSLTYITVY